MTRWKREYRQRAEARGFIVYNVPRKWQDWKAAWAYSEVLQHRLMQPEMIARLDAFAERHIRWSMDPRPC